MQLGRLVETMPDLNIPQLTDAEHQWLGRLDALLVESGDLVNLATLRSKVDWLGSEPFRAKTVQEMDEKALTDFAPLAPAGVIVRLLADQQHRKPSLIPAQQRWVAQYGAARPLEVRLAPARTLHDRLIIIDDTRTWVLTQSLNAFAARSPASLVRVDDGTSELKISAYEAVWAAAEPLQS